MLHSFNILNSKSFIQISKLQKLPNANLASVLVKELSHDIKNETKYHAFLEFLKGHHELMYVYYQIIQYSKLSTL